MNRLPENGILIAFGELFLKSEGVKNLFKKRLIWDLSFFLEKGGLNFKICDLRDRILVKTEETQKALKIIKKVFGISWLAQVLFFQEITLKEFSEFVCKNYPQWIKNNETFAIRLKLEKSILKNRREKVIDTISKDINRKVNLSKPKREIFIEGRKFGWFLYFKKIKGTGGFPVGSGGKVLTLISGGIDSPVAAFMVAKRGAENIWLHFHSFPLVSNKSIEKVKELAKIFLEYQPHLKIYFIPFQKAQIEIKTKTPPQYRILLYRRLMLQIAERIAERENCEALATGESLGQVSSQTLPNIKIIEEVVKIPVLRPLVGMDKEEIINFAKKIGTFEISIKPQEDCCTLFTPKHSTAKGETKVIKELEKKIKIKRIIEGLFKEIKTEKY